MTILKGEIIMVYHELNTDARQRLRCYCVEYGIDFKKIKIKRRRVDGVLRDYPTFDIGLSHVDRLIEAIKSAPDTIQYKNGKIVCGVIYKKWKISWLELVKKAMEGADDKILRDTK